MDSNMQELYRNSTMALMKAKKRMSTEGDPAFLDGARRVLDFMYKIWQDQKLCDVLIASNGGCVQAHRVVLGAYSDTLNRTFQGYNSGDMVKLDLTDFRSEVVMAIINFMYTTELELSCHIIGQVLACANELGIEVIIQICLDYLNNFDANNAILHYSIAENNNLNDVRDKAFFFIVDNFPDVSFTRHFLYLPFERILKIVCNENLCVNTEMDVFSAVVRWVDFDVRQRLSHGYQLLDCVNFENLPPESLVQEVEAVGWIINNPECVKNYLYRAMKYNALKGVDSPLADAYTPRERRCLKENQEEPEESSGYGYQAPSDGEPAPPQMDVDQSGAPRNSAGNATGNAARNSAGNSARNSAGNAAGNAAINSAGNSAGNSGDRQLSQHFRRTKRRDHEELQPIRGQGQGNEQPDEYEPAYKYGMVQDYEPQNGKKSSFGQQLRNAQQRSSNNISASVPQQSVSSSVDTFHLPSSGVHPPYRDFQSLQKRRELLKRQILHAKQGQSSQVTETREHSSKSGRMSNKRKKNPLGQIPQQQFQQQAFPLRSSTRLDGQQFQKKTLQSSARLDGQQFQKQALQSSARLDGQQFQKQALQSSARLDGQQFQKQALQSSARLDGQLPCIVAVGGIDLESIDPDTPGKYLFTYHSQYNRWSVLTSPMKKYIHHHGVGILDGMLYIVGGSVYKSNHPEDLGVATNEVHVFDPVSQNWYQAASLIYSRAYAAVVVWKNQILVVGGEDSAKQKLDTIECYDPVANNWAVITQMPGGAKVGASAAVLLDCLFVVGGYNKDREYGAVLGDVECYDLLSQRWTILAPLKIPRCHASLIEVKRRLFLIGGRTAETKRGVKSLSFVEEYDSSDDTWRRIANMETPRHDAGCTAVGSLIYIIGGMRSPNPNCLQSVECFNIATGTWVKGVEDFPHPVAGIACSVMACT